MMLMMLITKAMAEINGNDSYGDGNGAWKMLLTQWW